MKTSELTGALLDLWVAKAEGVDAALSDAYPDGSRCAITFYSRNHDGVLDGRSYCPSQHWSDGGPIIERERIAIAHFDNELDESRPQKWRADLVDGEGYFSSLDLKFEGQTPLIAAMRAYIASKYGDTVPDTPNA